MGNPAHFQGKRFAPAHASVSDGAKPVVEALLKCCKEVRIRNGVIERNVGARGFTVKIVGDTGALRMTVVTNGGKQQFYLYKAPPLAETVELLRSSKKLSSFLINAG